MEKKYYDLSQIEELSGGDNNFKKELISIFLEQTPEFLSNMKNFLAQQDWDNLAKEAHTAKSSALIFGMQNAGKNLKDVQLLSEARNTETLPQLYAEIEEELSKAVEQLAVVLNEL